QGWFGGAAQFDLGGVAADLRAFIAQLLEQPRYVLDRDRQKSVTVFCGAANRGSRDAADVDRYSAFLHRFGKGAHRAELDMLTVKAGRVVAPQRAQRLDTFVG